MMGEMAKIATKKNSPFLIIFFWKKNQEHKAR